MLKQPELHRARERWIRDEIVVDAYGPEERMMGWSHAIPLALPRRHLFGRQ